MGKTNRRSMAVAAAKPLAAKNRSLPPRPPLKRKILDVSAVPAPESAPGSGGGDSGVQVVVRVRPPSRAEEDGEGVGKDVCMRKSGPGFVEIRGRVSPSIRSLMSRPRR
ncbi:hypothetical protein E2562_006530 [Oryza meyeriana var. granulata]|uniref:Kinesin motor domain-containing protein n=1 Tax=Oryza meyeriana var. granulata TaxID=110450 RepID=A0A6G1BTV2_9ORYZ|nr:hypothetical protein E2562_006530 [Oryza meyeriana var. granulata]